MRWLLLIWLTLSPLPALAAEVLRAHAIPCSTPRPPVTPPTFALITLTDAPKGEVYGLRPREF